jgi:WD40 repeat protein
MKRLSKKNNKIQNKRLSKLSKKKNKIVNKRLSKINGGRPELEDNQCNKENNRCVKVAGLKRGINHDSCYVAFHATKPLLAMGEGGVVSLSWSNDPYGRPFVDDTEYNIGSFSGQPEMEEHILYWTPEQVQERALLYKDTLTGHSNDVRSVAFHPSAPYLATGSDDRTAKLWRLSPDNLSATCVATLEGHTRSVYSVAFHPTALLLATGSLDNTVKLWRLNDNGSAAVCVATLEGHSSWVTSVAFDPTGRFVASGSTDRTVKLWRLLSDNSWATCVSTLERHSSYVTSVAFHPTDPILATGSEDNTVKLWRISPDGSTATCVATLRGHNRGVHSLAFHPTKPFLATGSGDSTARLWQLSDDNSSATCVATLEGHSDSVTSLAFHPTAPLLAMGAENGSILWRCKILEVPYNNFILYPKTTGISESICNSLCPLCYVNLCIKNLENPNDSNGYLVKLSNGTPSKDFYVHYNCLYRYLVNGKFYITADVSIDSETIHQLLNIDNKADALAGPHFSNFALHENPVMDDEGDVFWSANNKNDDSEA